MKRKISISLVVLLLAFNAKATISFVTLLAGSQDAPENKSKKLSVTGDRIEGFRLPFISGLDHRVTFEGDFVDLCDRVEICSGDGKSLILRLKGSPLPLTKSKSRDGKGMLTFTIPASVLPAIEGTFNIRVRYSVEVNGEGDRLDCKVINRGVINSIEWEGTTLPMRQQSTPENETSILRANTNYSLRFTGAGLGNSVQLFTAHSHLFICNSRDVQCMSTDWPVLSLVAPNSTQILLSFRTPERPSLFGPNSNRFIDLNSDNPLMNLLFASDGVGNNIEWGQYIFHRYATNLRTDGNFTNLRCLSSRNPDLAIESFSGKLPLTFANISVTALGKTFKQIDPSSRLANTLGSVSVNTSQHSQTDIGNDATLGTITLHEIVLSGYVLNIKNSGSEPTNVTPNAPTFNVRIVGNRITDRAEQVATTPTLMTTDQINKLNANETTTYSVGILAPLAQFSKNLNGRKFQYLTFSRRQGEFFVDNALQTDSNIVVTLDAGNVIFETDEENNIRTF